MTDNNLISTDIQKAAHLIEQGKIVAFPTETVYGLAADAYNDKVVKSLFKLKNRCCNQPFLIHVKNINQAKELAIFDEKAEILAKHFWPGALTLILKKQKKTPLCDLITADTHTVGIRIPDHPMTLLLLEKLQNPITSTSANISGDIHPLRPKMISDKIKQKTSLILDGGTCPLGKPSTILDLTSEEPILLREGSITPVEIMEIIGPIQQ